MIYHGTNLASTVGTSLANNLSRLEEMGFDAWLRSQPEDERPKLDEKRNSIESARAAFRARRWEDAGNRLAEIPGLARLMGAEIASLTSLDSEGDMSKIPHIFLLHSATEWGRGCASVIRAFIVHRWKKLVEPREISELDDSSPEHFRNIGLRNLASSFAAILRNHRSTPLLIDATGGYKAQIAIAVVFGQVFNVPVMYRFESFSHKIWLPSLPVSLDLDVVGKNLDLLREDEVSTAQLRERFGEPLTEANPQFAPFRVCLGEPVRIDSENYYPISAFGQIMLDKWMETTDPGEPAIESASKRPKVRWGDHHHPKEAEEFARRLAEKAPWISRIETRSAQGLSHGKGIRFRLGSTEEMSIRCIWVEENFPVSFNLKTTAQTRGELEQALRFLDRNFSK